MTKIHQLTELLLSSLDLAIGST